MEYRLTVNALRPLPPCGGRVGMRGPDRKPRLAGRLPHRDQVNARSNFSPRAGRSEGVAPNSSQRGLLVPGVAATVALAMTASTAAFGQAPSTDDEILALMKTHCVACHAAEPTHEAFAKAPAGVLLETIAEVAANAARFLTQVVVNRAMPLGNETGMTDEERDRIAAWIEGRPK